MPPANASQTNPFLAYALRYAALKFPVIPLHGKLPHLKNGSHGWSMDPAVLAGWWKQWPRANIGLVTGHKFWALDIDPDKQGDVTLEALEAKYGRLPDTLQQITGGGGRHYLFAMPSFEVPNSASKIGPGVDTRGSGGYIAVPPSVHPETRRRYDWDGLDEFENQPILAAPDWLLGILREHKPEPRQQVVAAKFAEGTRNDELFRIAARLRNIGHTQAQIYALLKTTNQEQCSPALPDDELKLIVQSVERFKPGTLLTTRVEPPPKTNAKATKKPQDEPLPPRGDVEAIITERGGLGAYLASRGKRGVMAPWIDFNQITGGLHGGELVILAAGTSVGKTDWALNYSLHAAAVNRVGVAFFSLEMSSPEITDRLICLAGNIDRTTLKCEDLDPEEFQPAVDSLMGVPLYIVDCSSLTLTTLQHSLIELRKAANIGLVVVDYLQLMSSPRRYENRVQEVTALSRGLKLTAKETDLPFLVLSQLTRSAGREKRPPELYDLRDSGSIEQDANVVVFLYNPDNKYKDKTNVFAPIETIVAKNRNGPRGKVPMLFKASIGRFEQK